MLNYDFRIVMAVSLIWDGGRVRCSSWLWFWRSSFFRKVRSGEDSKCPTTVLFSFNFLPRLHLRIAVTPCFLLVDAPYEVFVPSEVMCSLVAISHPSLREGWWWPHQVTRRILSGRYPGNGAQIALQKVDSRQPHSSQDPLHPAPQNTPFSSVTSSIFLPPFLCFFPC